MRTAALSLIAICLSAPVLADQPGGDMTGFLEETPVSWRIDAERSEYHFESEGIGSLRILAEPQEVPSGIGSVRLMVMVADGTTSLLELRLEDEDGNPALGLSSEAGGQAMLDIDHNNDVCGYPRFGKRNLRFVGGVFDRTCVRPLSVAFHDATGRYAVRK
ncbi:hypothetical protein DTW92_18440, partial [Paracoccus pantotrophus]